MSYHQFIVPDDDEVLDIVGVMPVAEEVDSATRVVSFEVEDMGALRLSYNASGRSIRVRWTKGAIVLVDIFREGAERLVFESGKSGLLARINFELETVSGSLVVGLYPQFSIEDELIF